MTKLKTILIELKNHAPFTMFGAVTGILCMILLRNLEYETSRRIFYVFHPAHILLSTIVMTSMFELHSPARRLFGIFVVGFFGSVFLATLSDSIIPYIGELILGMQINPHGHEHTSFVKEAHIGFIEAWYMVLPAAAIGILTAILRPRTKFPHAGHILLSTWASSFHIIMAMEGRLSVWNLVGSFIFLFIAVWLPCCFGDIVFPLLFVKPALSNVEGSDSLLPHAHHHNIKGPSAHNG
jgi:hypothetical protein